MLKVNDASVPRSEKILGRADCLASDAVGDVVRITAAKIGHRYQVAAADPSSPAGMDGVAVIIRKDSATDCIVQFHGPVKGIFSGLNPGAAYFVGTDSTPAQPGDPSFPVAGGTTLFQQIGWATSDDELFFQPLTSVAGGPGGDGRYYKQPLTGVIDGANTTFTTALTFRHGGPGTEKVYYNGVLQEEGVGCDYEAQESGGVGTGYDTVEMAFPLNPGDKLVIDFVPDL